MIGHTFGALPGRHISAQEITQLEVHARGGNAHAQYLLSAAFRRAGRKEESRVWLARAAAGGYGDAICTQATIALKGVDGVVDLPLAERALREALAKGSRTAGRLLAVMLATGGNAEPDWQSGVALIVDGALGDDPASLRQLALLVEMASPGDPFSATCLLKAARANDAFAAFALLRRASQGCASARADELVKWSAALKARRHPLAHQVMHDAGVSEAIWVERDRAALIDLLKSLPGMALREVVSLSERPRVRRVDGLLTREECDYVIGVAAPQLHPSSVTNPETGAAMQHPERTSNDALLVPYESDIVIHAINLRLAAAAGLPSENGELLSVLRYERGQEYRPHVDFFGERNEEAAQFETAGQRIRTLLVYLNDDYEGGATNFIRGGFSVRGRAGDAVLFDNVGDDGKGDPSSLHAGLPVTSGAKWIISKWFRERAYRI